MLLLIAFAFLSGIITVLSPCILPILPIILTSSVGGVKTGVSRPLGVVTGFVLSFTFFTLFLSTIVRLSGIPSDSLRLVSVLVIAGFGVSLLIPQFQLMIEKLFSKLAIFMPKTQNKSGFVGGLLIGFSVGLLWTPCVGPILASVISLAITGTVTLDALLITLAYSLGTAIPMFLIILGGQNSLQKVPWLLSHLAHIQKIFGILMILTAIAIFFNFDRKFQTFILNVFPQYGVGLTKIEDNQLIREQLDKQTDNSSQETDLGKPMFKLLDTQGPLAPEIIAGGEWFNSQPLKLEGLRGKVVIIDFWTYSCINCQRTLPYLRSWYEKYQDDGLVIIGVHSPEFEFEKSKKNLEQAIKDFKLTYPIVQDNDFATWKAYSNRYWPAKYFIDKNGRIRFQHFGEGAYDESEEVIIELLKEAGASDLSQVVDNPTYQIQAKTPELYLGYDRIEFLSSPERIVKDANVKFTAPQRLENNRFAFTGNWTLSPEYASAQAGSTLELNFEAKKVFLVMSSKQSKSKVRVYLDDKLQTFSSSDTLIVNQDTLYQLIDLPSVGKHILRLEFEDDNAQLFAFTFE